jgi:hypothetical protein
MLERCRTLGRASVPLRGSIFGTDRLTTLGRLSPDGLTLPAAAGACSAEDNAARLPALAWRLDVPSGLLPRGVRSGLMRCRRLLSIAAATVAATAAWSTALQPSRADSLTDVIDGRRLQCGKRHF